MGISQLVATNWLSILLIVIALAILIVLLWRNYDIEEITPAPPFIKFKRKSNSTSTNTQKASINITNNKMWGKNKIGVRRENVNVSENSMLGENEIEVGAKPNQKSKRAKKKK